MIWKHLLRSFILGLYGTGARQFTISCGLTERQVVAKFSIKFFILNHSATLVVKSLLQLKICIQKLPIIARHALVQVGIVCIVNGVLSVLHDWMTACHTVSVTTTAAAGLVITSHYLIIWLHYFMLHCWNDFLTTNKYLGTGVSHQILGHKHYKYQAEWNWPKISQEK